MVAITITDQRRWTINFIFSTALHSANHAARSIIIHPSITLQIRIEQNHLMKVLPTGPTLTTIISFGSLSSSVIKKIDAQFFSSQIIYIMFL